MLAVFRRAGADSPCAATMIVTMIAFLIERTVCVVPLVRARPFQNITVYHQNERYSIVARRYF